MRDFGDAQAETARARAIRSNPRRVSASIPIARGGDVKLRCN